jgi:hypothetical protein
MKNVRDIANGRGYIYATAPDGTTLLYAVPNDSNGLRQMRELGLLSAGLTGEVLAHGSLTFTAAVSGNITAVNINGVNQLSGNVAAVAGDLAATALAVRNNINAYTPGSGPDYIAHVSGAELILIPPPGYGDGLNNLTVAMSAGAGITATADNMNGGADANDIFDTGNGYRFWLDANYGAGDMSGEGTATEDDISNAIEITTFMVMRGLQSKLDTPSSTLANDMLTIERSMAFMYIDVDTEGAGGADNLKTIDTGNWVFGDIIALRAVNSGRVTTVKHTSGAGENIYLQSSTDFALGTKNRLIWLQYVNDNGTAKWIEVFRTPDLVTLTVTALRAASIPVPVSGTHAAAVSSGGGTITLEPGTDKGTQIYTGTVTLAGSVVIQGGGTPLDGDTFRVEWRSLATVGGNTVTIFGLQLTAAQALKGRCIVIAVYDLANTTWRAILIQDMSVTEWIENAMIADGTITGAKMVNSSIPNAKLTTPPPATYATEIITIPVSFEVGEIGPVKVRFNYSCTINRADICATKTLAATDPGEVVITGIPETLSLDASAAVGDTDYIIPSTGNIITAGTEAILTSSKVSPGGRALVILEVTRL